MTHFDTPQATLITLNIGLDRNNGKGSFSAGHAIVKCLEAGLRVQAGRTETAQHEYGTEKTAVIEVLFIGRIDDLVEALYRVCLDLDQDCIAYAYADSSGKLVGGLAGPNAEKWGEFNPEYFIPLDAAIDLSNAA